MEGHDVIKFMRMELLLNSVIISSAAAAAPGFP